MAVSQSIRFWKEIYFHRGQQGDLYCKFPPLYPGWKSWRSNGRNVWWGALSPQLDRIKHLRPCFFIVFTAFPGFFLDIVEEPYNMITLLPSIKRNLPSDLCASWYGYFWLYVVTSGRESVGDKTDMYTVMSRTSGSVRWDCPKVSRVWRRRLILGQYEEASGAVLEKSLCKFLIRPILVCLSSFHSS